MIVSGMIWAGLQANDGNRNKDKQGNQNRFHDRSPALKSSNRREVIADIFQQTGRTGAHIRPGETQSESVNVHVTRPSRSFDPATQTYLYATPTFIPGSIRRTNTGWEPGEQLSNYLSQAGGSGPLTGWPDIESAARNIEGIVIQAWRKSAEHGTGQGTPGD